MLLYSSQQISPLWFLAPFTWRAWTYPYSPYLLKICLCFAANKIQILISQVNVFFHNISALLGHGPETSGNVSCLLIGWLWRCDPLGRMGSCVVWCLLLCIPQLLNQLRMLEVVLISFCMVVGALSCWVRNRARTSEVTIRGVVTKKKTCAQN